MSSPNDSVQISHDQSYIHLASIQSASLGLPAVVLGQQLTQQYGAGIAICSILVGNLILWAISMSIISMAIVDRTNAVQNVRNYLGKYGALFMTVILMIAFLDWFVLQINSSIPSIGNYFDLKQGDILVRTGAGIGFVTALFAIGGIRFIKWASVASLPGLFCYYAYSIFQSSHSAFPSVNWGFSMPAIIATVLTLLPGAINLPTFFRHARSRADCYLALTIMMMLISFFEISTIWMNLSGDSIMTYMRSEHPFYSFFTLVFVILTLILTNLLNIYFASACWETFIPRFEGAKGYAIIGLIGTASYTFIQIYAPVRFVENLANCYIASLGAVLLISFLIRIIVRHRPRAFEQGINGFCWLVGCATSTALLIQESSNAHPLLIGIAASILVFLLIIFIEETIWSISNIQLDQ